MRLFLQLFHYTLDQFFGIGQALHDDLDVQDWTSGPALALAINSVLADKGHSVGNRVHGHCETAAWDTHHGLKVLQLFVFFLKYGHGEIVTKQAPFGIR